jgi:hypothetical protein
MLNETKIQDFKARLRGELLQRSDPEYEEARQLYNGMIDKQPLLIARCADVADVIAAVRFGRRTTCSLPFAAAATTGRDWAAAMMDW